MRKRVESLQKQAIGVNFDSNNSLPKNVRRRVEHEKRNSESTSDHVLFGIIWMFIHSLCRHVKSTLLTNGKKKRKKKKNCITKVTSVKSRGVLKSLVCSCSYFEFHISLYFFLSFSLFIYYFRKVYYVS